MMAMVWALMKANTPASIAGIATGILLCMFAFERHEVEESEVRQKLCMAQNEALSLSNSALLASLREQNAAVNRMKQMADFKKKRADQVSVLAHTKAKDSQLLVERIHAAKPLADECAELKQLLRQFALP